MKTRLQPFSTPHRIFLLDNHGNLLAVDSNTGRKIWERKTYANYDPDTAEFSYHEHTVLVSGSEASFTLCPPFENNTFGVEPSTKYEQVMAFNANSGTQLWETCSFVSGWLSYSEHSMIGNAQPNTNLEDTRVLTAFDLETGRLNWYLTLPHADELGVMTNDQREMFLLFRSYEGGPDNFHELAKLMVLDELSGKLIWQFNNDFSHGNLYYKEIGNTVFVGTEDGYIFALDATNGDVIWQTKTGHFAVTFLMQGGNNLIAIDMEKYVSALDAQTGAQKWIINVGLDPSWSILGIQVLQSDENTLYVAGNDQQKVYAVDMKTGNVLWSWSHFYPGHSEYELYLLDHDFLYVNQWPPDLLGQPFGTLWFFALKTEP